MKEGMSKLCSLPMVRCFIDALWFDGDILGVTIEVFGVALLLVLDESNAWLVAMIDADDSLPRRTALISLFGRNLLLRTSSPSRSA